MNAAFNVMERLLVSGWKGGLPWAGIAVLALSSALGVAMLVARVLYGGRGHGYLVWNLFLAWLPLGFACATCLAAQFSHFQRRLVFLLGCGWLLFLPNAPYIVTDLVHLRLRPPVPLWYDVLLLMVFAWTGVLLGFTSLQMMQRLVTERWGVWRGWLFALAALLLASFGIYLGRFQRWNSWDAMFQPLDVAADIAHRIFVPWEHPRTWGFTVCFFAFLKLAYACFAVWEGVFHCKRERQRP